MISVFLFLLTVIISATLAARGLNRGKPAHIGIALTVGVVGAVLTAVYTYAAVTYISITFAVILGVLGFLIVVDGVGKRDPKLSLQGLIQLLVAALLFGYVRIAPFLKGHGEGLGMIAIGIANLPWLLLAIALLVIIIRSDRPPR